MYQKLLIFKQLIINSNLTQPYYRPVGVFLLYNFLDLVGRTLATWLPAMPIKVALLLAIARYFTANLFVLWTEGTLFFSELASSRCI